MGNSSVLLDQRGVGLEKFPVWDNQIPAATSATTGRSFRGESDRIKFPDRQHLSVTENAADNFAHEYRPNPNQSRRSQHEQERQYYNFAKENLITFGGWDAPSAGTGLSQEELLQRKRNEETREKRKEKRRNRTGKNRILNFPSSLLKTSPQHTLNSNQNKTSPPYYQKMPMLSSNDSASYEQDIVERDRDNQSSKDNTNRNKGIGDANIDDKNFTGNKYMAHEKRSMVIHDDLMEFGNGGKDDFDRFMEKSDAPQGKSRDVTTPKSRNTDHDYLLVQTPKNRPLYADFTPRSKYSPRDLHGAQNPPNTKYTSPTSVMDIHVSNSASVRWNKNLTQQEVIGTPQSTKLRSGLDHVQLRNSAGKPKSILRSRYPLSHASKVQTGGRTLDNTSECPSDEYVKRYERDYVLGQNTVHHFDSNHLYRDDGSKNPSSGMMGVVEENRSYVPPIRTDRLGEGDRKFPESYVHFIEAVAAVVIQTKIRQKLAKKQVEMIRNEKYNVNERIYRGAHTKMNPLVRKSRELARKVRQGNENNNLRGRKDVALDFYALAAIQIQAAFRGWWVRDCLGVDNYCAAIIQKTYRGSRCRNLFRKNVNRIITVQSVCRRWMAIDTAVTRIYCIVRIQAIARGFLIRNRMKRFFLENNVYHVAAIKIQTLWRGFSCEMTFLRAYEDILVVQSIVRGWIARRRFRSLLEPKYSRTSQQSMINGRLSKFRSRMASQKNYTNRPSVLNKASNLSKANVGIRAQSTISDKESKNNNSIYSHKKFSSKSGSKLLKGRDIKLENKKSETQTNKVNTLSISRSDIERRRKLKEEEKKASKEKESRRLESEAAEMAEIEFRRKRMAMKAAARKSEQSEMDQLKPPANPTTSLDEACERKDDSEKEKSTVAKRLQELHTSNKTLKSTGKNGIAVTKTHQFPIQNASQKKFGGKVESKIEVKSTEKTNPSEQTNSSNARYHKQMQNSRSESEQKRIDGMHHIFQQAGLLDAAKNYKVDRAKINQNSNSQKEMVDDSVKQAGLLDGAAKNLEVVRAKINQNSNSQKEMVDVSVKQAGLLDGAKNLEVVRAKINQNLKSRKEMVDDSKKQAGLLGAAKKPFAAAAPTFAPASIETIKSVKATSTSPTDTKTTQHKKLLMLLSSYNTNPNQRSAQDRAITILTGLKIEPELVDGGDPTQRSRRNKLIVLSRGGAKYPQFFLIDTTSGSTEFLADWKDFGDMHERGSLKLALGEVITTTNSTANQNSGANINQNPNSQKEMVDDSQKQAGLLDAAKNHKVDRAKSNKNSNFQKEMVDDSEKEKSTVAKRLQELHTSNKTLKSTEKKWHCSDKNSPISNSK